MINFLTKVSACFIFNIYVLIFTVNASSLLEEESTLKKFTNAFCPINPDIKAPSVRTTTNFRQWQATFEKAIIESTKYNYLKFLQKEEAEVLFGKLEENRASLEKISNYVKEMQYKELDTWNETNALNAFMHIAEIFLSLSKFHEQAPHYLSKRHHFLSEKYNEFSQYKETENLKKFKDLFISNIDPLMKKFSGDNHLYQNTDTLMKMSQYVLEAQQLSGTLSNQKLKKRKGSSPASASSSPKNEGIKKSRLRVKPRSKSFSGQSSSKIPPIYKQLADEAITKRQSDLKTPTGK